MIPTVIEDENFIVYRVCYSDFHFTSCGSFKFSPLTSIQNFANWSSYKDHLITTTNAIFANGQSGLRQSPLTPLSSISRGYDSAAVSAIAAECGCHEAVTLKVRRDNGKKIAQALKIKTLAFPHILGFRRFNGLRHKLQGTTLRKSLEFVATAGLGET